MTICFTERQLDDLKPGQEIELELTDDARRQVLAWHNSHQPRPQPVSGDVELQQILDAHAEYYIRQTMKFFQEAGESPALSKNNEGDLKAIEAIESYLTKFKERAVGQGKFIAVSLLLEHIGYLLAHRSQGGLPEMTAEVIGNLWDAAKQIQEENDKHMRRELRAKAAEAIREMK